MPAKPGMKRCRATSAAIRVGRRRPRRRRRRTTTPTIAAITASSRRKPFCWSAEDREGARRRRSAPAGKSGMPKSRLRPSAAPTTSATSQAIATISAWIQRPIEVRREKESAADLGEVLAGRDPELRRLGLDDHRDQVGREDDPEQQVAELGAAGDVGGEVARVDVGDGGDEGRAEEGPDARQAPWLSVERAPRRARDGGLARQDVLDSTEPVAARRRRRELARDRLARSTPSA